MHSGKSRRGKSRCLMSGESPEDTVGQVVLGVGTEGTRVLELLTGLLMLLGCWLIYKKEILMR